MNEINCYLPPPQFFGDLIVDTSVIIIVIIAITKNIFYFTDKITDASIRN